MLISSLALVRSLSVPYVVSCSLVLASRSRCRCGWLDLISRLGEDSPRQIFPDYVGWLDLSLVRWISIPIGGSGLGGAAKRFGGRHWISHWISNPNAPPGGGATQWCARSRCLPSWRCASLCCAVVLRSVLCYTVLCSIQTRKPV